VGGSSRDFFLLSDDNVGASDDLYGAASDDLYVFPYTFGAATDSEVFLLIDNDRASGSAENLLADCTFGAATDIGFRAPQVSQLLPVFSITVHKSQVHG